MKKLILALGIFASAGLCLVPLRTTTAQLRDQQHGSQAACEAQTWQLAEVEAEQAALESKIKEAKRDLRGSSVSADAAVGNSVHGGINARATSSVESVATGNSSRDYVMVSKAALSNITLKALSPFPNNEKLTAAARGVLAITPAEQRAVEAAFAETFSSAASWAKANVKREGPTEEMLFRYTLPADAEFEQSRMQTLFEKINAAIGAERAGLLHSFFDHNRISEDGCMADKMTVFEVHRITKPPGLGCRSGWRTDHGEAINTYPEPIRPNHFPAAFHFVFPGGWQEVAQREGLELPEEFKSPQ